MKKDKKPTPTTKPGRYLETELTNFENALDTVIKEGDRDKIIQVSVILARLRQLEANVVTELNNIYAPLLQAQKQAQQPEAK